MKKAKKTTIIESQHVTLIPSLTNGSLIDSHQDLVLDLYPHYKDWFFDPNQFEDYDESEVIFSRINHPLSWVCWSNKDQRPIGFIIFENIYGLSHNPRVVQADLLGLPGSGLEMTLGVNEAIHWTFKNTNVQRIEAEVPQKICTSKVYKSLGFIEEGLKRNAIEFQGKPLHCDVLGLLKSDYYVKHSRSYKTKEETINKINGLLACDDRFIVNV